MCRWPEVAAKNRIFIKATEAACIEERCTGCAYLCMHPCNWQELLLLKGLLSTKHSRRHTSPLPIPFLFFRWENRPSLCISSCANQMTDNVLLTALMRCEASSAPTMPWFLSGWVISCRNENEAGISILALIFVWMGDTLVLF